MIHVPLCHAFVRKKKEQDSAQLQKARQISGNVFAIDLHMILPLFDKYPLISKSPRVGFVLDSMSVFDMIMNNTIFNRCDDFSVKQNLCLYGYICVTIKPAIFFVEPDAACTVEHSVVCAIDIV